MNKVLKSSVIILIFSAVIVVGVIVFHLVTDSLILKGTVVEKQNNNTIVISSSIDGSKGEPRIDSIGDFKFERLEEGQHVTIICKESGPLNEPFDAYWILIEN
ncbi:hypothetical protein [Salimicrobium halophilum]|uniref:Uncharacterized protein n=1 Tax=Salimicrobium halophilum TaxID=86666 RepID=A0A1G8RG97_9BACI|nr:hypothetical protein [Salimicrobium halophilum]SDJ16037.1 hypothetical protein SAMN04490247_1017 [Salimicrobium halophilum]